MTHNFMLERIAARGIRLQILAFLLSHITVLPAAEEGRLLPELQVIASASTTNVRVQEPFNLNVRVENPTPTNQTIRVMNGNWQQHWQSSNTNVTWMAGGAAKNFPLTVTIPPGGAYTNQLSMLIYNLIRDKELSFRMGFTSIGSGKTLWSNEIKLHILPPDTWVRAGKYYRDRNHDGKIDWEVSGSTWMGHAVYPKGNSWVPNRRTVTRADGSVAVVEEWAGQGVDVYKVDTNYDGFYDLKYGAGGTNGQIQWTKPIHEKVPVVRKDFFPRQKESWMDWWMR